MEVSEIRKEYLEKYYEYKKLPEEEVREKIDALKIEHFNKIKDILDFNS